MKILDSWDYLQLVSCMCLLVLTWEHFEKQSFQNFVFKATQKMFFYKHQNLLYFVIPLLSSHLTYRKQLGVT